MKLIYIFTTRVIASYEKEYGISHFRNRGWEIEICDMSPIITPVAYERIKTGVYIGNDIRLFYSKREYKEYIKNMKGEAVFICPDFNRLSTQFLFHNLRKEHLHGFFWLDSPTTTAENYSNKIRKFDMKRILNSLYIRLPHVIQKIPPAGFIIMSMGEEHERLKELAYKNKNTIIKYVPGSNFEQYLQTKNKKGRLIQEKYCVFIDEYIGYHPDIKEIGIVYTQDEIDLYYAELRNFFCYLEKSMGLKVIVALHPRADYSNHPECYKGFRTIRFKTVELVKDCEFAMTHYSDAIAYAVLFHKPCFMIRTTMIKKTSHMIYIMDMIEKQFHMHQVNISSEDYKNLRLQDFLKTDSAFLDECIKRYYYRDYVDENTEIKSLWSQVEECIEEVVKMRSGKVC